MHVIETVGIATKTFNKKGKLEEYTHSYNVLKRDLNNTLSSIDFLFLTSLFLVKNLRAVEEIELSQNIK